jgi:hypothetical protein
MYNYNIGFCKYSFIFFYILTHSVFNKCRNIIFDFTKRSSNLVIHWNTCRVFYYHIISSFDTLLMNLYNNLTCIPSLYDILINSMKILQIDPFVFDYFLVNELIFLLSS